MIYSLIVVSVVSTIVSVMCTSIKISPLYSDDYEEVIDSITFLDLDVRGTTFLYMIFTTSLGLVFLAYVGLYHAIVILVLILISVIDLKYKLIPNRFIVILILSIALLYSQDDFISIYEIGTRTFTALALFIGLFLVAYFSQGKFGGADIKIFTALAFFFNLDDLTVTMVIVSALLIVTFFVIYFVDKTKPIPLVPYITIASMVTIFFGNEIIQLYMGR